MSDPFYPKFNKEVFHKLYHDEITVEFEANFLEIFGCTYKEFLQKTIEEHNHDLVTCASYLGLQQKTLQNHLNFYSIKRILSIKQWQKFFMGNMFVITLKAVLSFIGTIPIFYYAGYLILYGYFFGDTDHSFLDIMIKNVPINRASCYITGFAFSGFVAFWISIFKLRRVGKVFLTFGALYFLLASSVTLLYSLFTIGTSITIINFKDILLAIWLFPLVAAFLLLIVYSSISIFTKYYKEIFICVILIGPVLTILIYYNIEPIWIIILCIIQIIIYFPLSRVASKKGHLKWPTKKVKPVPTPSPVMKFTWSEFIMYILLVLSLVIVIATPMLSFIMFSAGHYLGSSLAIFNLKKNEEIRIGDRLYEGKLISRDDNFYYISTYDRKLITVSKDSSIKISNGAKTITYTGESANLIIELTLSSKNEELWYSGTIKHMLNKKISKVSYSIEQIDKISIDYSVPSDEVYIVNKIKSEEINDLKSITITWYSEEGEDYQEVIPLKS